MNPHDGFGRMLDVWLADTAPVESPGLHDEVIQRARTMRQRRRWLARLHSITLTPVPSSVRMTARYGSVVVALVLAALLLAVAAALVGSRQQRLPQPFGPAANGSLLYDRAGDIFSADPAATGETLLVGGPTIDVGPLWSRDGTRFAFLRMAAAGGAFVMVASADGSHLLQVTDDPLFRTDRFDIRFDWSPDGRRLVVYHKANGRGAISILDADVGGRVRALDVGRIEPASIVAWRPPSGAELIFLGHPGAIQTDLGLYAVRPDGAGLRQIALQRNEPAGSQDSFQDLSLSADGSTATFWNSEPGVRPGHDTSVHLLDLTTGSDRRMTYDSTAISELRAVLSPDGTTIVFERQDLDGVAQLMAGPTTVGTGPGAVRVGPKYRYDDEHAFDISPDGSTIILSFGTGQTRLIDVRNNATEIRIQDLPALPSWQRLAP